MLRLEDILFTIAHLVVILFNLFGWIPVVTRKAHFIVILLTAASWFILGIWYGLGYCFLTDWHWKVKEQLGEINLPDNFVEYFAERLTGRDFDSNFVDIVTGSCFGIAVIISVYVNFFRSRK